MSSSPSPPLPPLPPLTPLTPLAPTSAASHTGRKSCLKPSAFSRSPPPSMSRLPPLSPPLSPAGPVKISSATPTAALSSSISSSPALAPTSLSLASPALARALAGGPPAARADADHSLHAPLKLHLRFLHPQTPPTVLSFVARRLLSPERPHGFAGEWAPLVPARPAAPAGPASRAAPEAEAGPDPQPAPRLDLATLGVGADAAAGLEQRGPGAALDRRLADMYAAARASYRRLEVQAPGVDKL